MQVHWWTPHGQAKDNQPELLINDITEQHAGLYICITGVQGEHISVFDLHVYKKGGGSRLRREAAVILDKQENVILPKNPAVRQVTRTESEFVLAVCLSVIITFILAFILGVVLRPLLDKLWRRIRSKRQSTSSPTSSTEPQPYVNEGYCDVEDHGREVRVGPRVRFGGITEVEDQMPYYVTVDDDQADGSSESNTEAGGLYEDVEDNRSSVAGGKQQALEMERHRGRADSSSSSSLQEGEVNALVINGQKLPPSSTEDMEFEPIPDETEITKLKRRASSSASSHSSQEFTVSSEIRNSTEQSVDPSPVSNSEMPGFIKEPFSEWPVRLKEQNVDDLDPELWNDSGESFSFNEDSESIQDLSSSALGHPMKEDDEWRQVKVESPSNKINIDSDVDFDKPLGKEVLVDDGKQFEFSDNESSCNSSQSGESVGGPNNYTVNPELEEEIVDESDTGNGANVINLNRFGTLEDATFSETMPSAGILIRQETVVLEPSDIHLTFTHGNSVDEGMLTDDSSMNIPHKSGLFADMVIDTVPKVTRYVEFKQSKSHSGSPSLSPSSQKKNISSKVDVLSEANTDASFEDNSYLIKREVSPDSIQKVKRYINFKQSDPHTPTLPSPTLTKKDAMLDTKRYSLSSDDDAQLTTKDDNSFWTKCVPSDKVSKVKRYISFKQFDTSSPTLSLPKSETTTEATIQTMQPSSSPNDSSQNVKEYMFFKQYEHRSSSLPSSPTSTRKVLSGKKSKSKKRNDKSFYGSHESLPLYHVHPSYRSSINRLNRGYDTDRSFSSEDEDQFIEYPRKLEITTAPGLNRGSITPGKNKDNVLNIDFDNSSSSTDVFEKKRSKGLLRLRALGARLFNRNENETDVMTSPADWDVGKTGGVSVNKHSKLTKKQTTNEDIIFGKSLSLDHLPKVKRYIQFSHSYPQAQLPSPPPTTGTVTPDFKVTTESRTSSFSSEDDFKPTTEDETFVGQVDESFDRFPKVKRYIQFSHVEPYSTTLPSKGSPELVVKPEARKSSTSSDDDDDIKPNEDNFFSKIGVSFDNMPHVKRYIQFNQPKPYSPTQTSSPISIKRPVVGVESSSSTSVKSDDKSDATGNQGQIDLIAVPKVKRYVQFTEFKNRSSTPPLVSSSSTKDTTEMEIKTESKIDRFPGDQGKLMQAEVSLENIPKVKRYIHFKQSEPHPTTSDTLHVTPEMIIKSETRRSSEGDVRLTKEEGHVLEETGASLNSVPRVKRYIQFTYPESRPLTQLSTSPSSERVNASVADKETRRCSTSEEDVKPANKVNIEETGGYHVQIPKVKRYIKFTQAEPYSSPQSPIPPATTVKEIRQPANRGSTSSENDVQEDIGFGQIGVSFDKVPRVKRYIQFTHPENQSPAQTSTSLSSERVSIPVLDKETRKWSTSSEEDVEPSTEDIKETDEYLAQIPKVKRYIKFTPSKPYSSALSPDSPISTVKSITVTETEFKQPVTKEKTSSKDNVQEDNVFGQIGVSLDGVPRVKRYIAFTHPETSTALSDERIHESPTAKKTKGSSTLSEENVTISTNKDIIKEADEHLVKIPKVKRYIMFKQSESFNSDLLPVPPSIVKSTKVTETELKQPITRESTSEDDVQEDFGFGQIGVSLDGVPRVKRYIQFTHPESQSLTESTTAVSAENFGILGVVQDTRRSSTSSEEDATPIAKEDKAFGQTELSLEKIPKVKRYIQFANTERKLVQPTTDLSVERLEISGVVQETRRSSTSSEDDVKPSTHDDNVRGEYFDKIPKMKRYIKFTQSEPSHGLAPLPILGNVKPIQVTDLQSRGSSTLVDPSPKEDNVFGETEAHLNKIPRVKRYIEFAHQFPVQSTTTLSADKVATSKVILETSRPSTSSEDEVTIAVKEDYFDQRSVVPLDKIPKVKRYIQFTHPESQFPVQTTAERVNASVVKKETSIPYTSSDDERKSSTNDHDVIKETSVTIPKVKRYIEFTQPYSSAQTQLPSVVKPIKGTATEPRESHTSQSTSSGNSDSLPRVKRYIQFTPAESHYSALPSTAVLAERSEVTEEPKLLTTSSKYVKPSANDYVISETDEFIANIPKVKRYIEFKRSKPYSLDVSSFPPSSSLSSEPSLPISKKKGSAVIIKTELESWTSDQTGLNSELSKSSSLPSEKLSVGHQVEDEPPAVPITSPPPLELDAREYLRENSEVRQRQERRRLLQQRRREMDEFNIAPLSVTQQEAENQDRTLADYGGAPFQTERTYSSASTRNNSRSTEGVEAPVLRGLKTKSTSLDSKSPANSTTKNKEFLI